MEEKKTLNLKELLETKTKELEEVKAKIAQFDTAKSQLLQYGIELQGRIKQLNELIALTEESKK